MIKKKPKSTVTCVSWHPNNQLIAVGSCDYRVRIYSAYIKAVDNQLQTSAWGKIANTGELLHEFSCGRRVMILVFLIKNIDKFRIWLDT